MLWRCSANAFPTSSPLGLLVDVAAELQTWHGHAEGPGRPRPLRPTGLRASQSLGPWASAGRVRNRPLPPAAFRFDGRSGTEERWGETVSSGGGVTSAGCPHGEDGARHTTTELCTVSWSANRQRRKEVVPTRTLLTLAWVEGSSAGHREEPPLRTLKRIN